MKYYFYVYLFTQENCAAQINMAACCKLAVKVQNQFLDKV